MWWEEVNVAIFGTRLLIFRIKACSSKLHIAKFLGGSKLSCFQIHDFFYFYRSLTTVCRLVMSKYTPYIRTSSMLI